MMPYIYKNTEHFWRVHGEDIGMGILRGDKMKEKSFYGLTYYDGEPDVSITPKRKSIPLRT